MTDATNPAVRGTSRSGLLATIRRFRKADEGATALEFGLIAAPFFALFFAIIETAVVFFAGQTLEVAVADSARLIRTGQVQQQNVDQAAFKSTVCNHLKAMFDCANGIHIDVRCYSAFSPVNLERPVDDEGNLKQDDFQFCPGGPEEIVIVRVMYQWPVFVSLLGFNLADMAGGKRLLMATAAFRNEAYPAPNP